MEKILIAAGPAGWVQAIKNGAKAPPSHCSYGGIKNNNNLL